MIDRSVLEPVAGCRVLAFALACCLSTATLSILVDRMDRNHQPPLPLGIDERLLAVPEMVNEALEVVEEEPDDPELDEDEA